MKKNFKKFQSPKGEKFSKTKPSKTTKSTKTIHEKPQPKPLFVWGRHVVESFLNRLTENKEQLTSQKFKFKNPYYLHVIVDKSGKVPGQLAHIHESAKLLGIKTITHKSEQSWPLGDVQESIVHQRVCLQVPEYPTEDISLACDIVKTQNQDQNYGCAGIILDQIQDPRNFGAIIRSAAFFGVKFVIYAQNRQADISPLVLKASAGGAFNVHLIPVVNLNRAIENLKEADAWILGTANSEDATPVHQLPKDRVWVTVFGHEGTGMRAEIKKNCDYTTKIDGGTQTLDSLNVSVAAGIVLHSLQSRA